MSEWIPAWLAKPPESHSVLLYIVQFYEDGTSVYDTHMFSGFWGNEDYDEVGFYLERPMGHDFLKESKIFRVMGWTLLPRSPTDEILKDGGEWSC